MCHARRTTVRLKKGVGKKNYSREVTERTGSNKETDWRKERDDGVWAADNVALL